MSPTLSKIIGSGKFLQPTNVAVVASFGIHALVLGLALPGFSSLSSQSNPLDPRTVNLVELSPLEQSRLPDISSSMVDLGAAANLGNIAASLPPADNSLAFSLPLPNSIDSLPPPPSLPQLPLSSLSTPAYFPQLPSLPPPPPATISFPPIAYNPQNIPFPSMRAPIYAEPEVRVSFPPTPPPMGIRDLINQKPYDSEMGLPLQPPNVIANNQGLRGENENIPPSLAVGAEIARRRQEALMAALKERAISLQNDRTNTSDEEARKNYVNWAVAVKAENKPETLNIAGIYPKDACLRRLSGSAVYGVLANAQGRASNVELIKSSGYPILNQQAIAQINSLGFPNATGNSKPYTVNVSFNYDRQVCPSYGTAPTPSIEATKSPEVPDNLPENTNPQLVKPEVSPNPPVEARKEPPEPNNQATPVNPPLEARKEPIEPNNQPTPVNPPVEARKEPVAPPDTQTPPPPPESTAVQPRDEEKNLAPAPAASVKVPEDSEMSPTAPAAPPKMETTEVQN